MDPEVVFSHPNKIAIKWTDNRVMFSSRTESLGDNDFGAGGFADNVATLVFFFQSKYLKNIVE